MSFLTPLAWAGLSLGALVAATYFLRQRPQPYEVSALFLWPRAPDQPRHTWRWQRAPLGLLLVQLAALALLVGSLARPVILTRAQEAQRVALIVDTSASMRMKTPQGTRFQLAVQRARALVSERPRGEWTLIEARQGGGVRLPLTADRGLVREALGALRPSYLGEAPAARVVQWLRSQAPLATFDRIVWLTDHPPDEPLVRELGLEVSLVLGGQDNAAISAFALRSQPDPSLGYEAFVAVRNDGAQPLITTLKLSAAERLVLSLPVEVPPGDERRYALPLSGQLPARARARLEVEDGLAFDNERVFALRPRTRPRAFWLGEPDPFLAQALLASGVEAILPWTLEATPATSDLIVVNQASLPAEGRGNVLLVDSDWEGVLRQGAPQAVEAVRATDATHPLLEGLHPEDLAVLEARPVRAPSGSVPLLLGSVAEGAALPLLGTFRDEHERLAWLAFPLEKSNLRLTVDFPILIANLLHWLVPLPRAAAILDTGAPLPLGDGGGRVRLPSGRALDVDGPVFLATDAPGFYPLPGRGVTWAVNVPLAESLPASTPPLPAGGQGTVTPPAPSEATLARPLWAALGWLGLLALCWEWCSYERRWL